MRFCLVLIFLVLPMTAMAQEHAPVDGTAKTATDKGQNAQTAQNQDKTAVSPQASAHKTSQSRSRRGRRVIVNREFDDREKIMLLLNAHCDFPTKHDLLSTSADAEKHLHSILNDSEVLFSVRMRAIEALAYFETEYNVKMLRWVLENPDKIQRPLMLMQAIRAYPKIAASDAPAVLERYLSSDNDMIRFVTINALKNCPGQAAVDVLKKRYAIEKNRFFQSRLKDAIDGHCRRSTYCSP